MVNTTAVCAFCGTRAKIKDEGELPIGWFAIIEKCPSHDPHRRFHEASVPFHDWACLTSYIVLHPNITVGSLVPAPVL